MLLLLPRPQEPFEIIGRLIPKYDGNEWTYTEELLDTPREKLYPDDSFDPKTYIDNPSEAAFLAMADGNCVGSIRVSHLNQHRF
jgi:streptothricin acetyltransferase